MKKILFITLAVLLCFAFQTFAQIPIETLVKISRAEDELRFDKTLEDLLKSADAGTRTRAILAAGRIGDEKAIPVLTGLLTNDKNDDVRAMAAFALGEIESIKAADAILNALRDEKISASVKARAVEAAGKIAAANPKDEKSKTLGEAILDSLEKEAALPSKDQHKDVILLGTTAALRAKPDDAEYVVAKFLTNLDARVRADAANTLARLRVKNSNEKFRAMLLTDDDAAARANAARALGAAEDKESVIMLIEAALTDPDLRVRVNAIRSLGALKDAKSAEKLLERGEKLLDDYEKSEYSNPVELNELLEITTALGTLLPAADVSTDLKKVERVFGFLSVFRRLDGSLSSETEIAFARILPRFYWMPAASEAEQNWRKASAISQGLSEFSKIEATSEDARIRAQAVSYLTQLLRKSGTGRQIVDEDAILLAIPDVLTAYAEFKTEDLDSVLREYLRHNDVFARTTAAGLLGEQTASKENVEALEIAFASALKTDTHYDDAQLAIISALVKLDKKVAVTSLRLALDAPGFLVRRQAAKLIVDNDLTKDIPDYEKKVGNVRPYDPTTGTKLGQVLNSEADYRRAVSRRNGTTKAVLTTEKGTLTIDLLPKDAPLTVDNFIKLARSGYFNNVAIHRVVPNFVVQDGDPLGNGSGGPGWQIRCEVNTVPYERGAVGMALSGKDTGGSQWFVTHSPQPHLDGGYTVFGMVSEADMKTVDKLVRRDKILKVEIIESK